MHACMHTCATAAGATRRSGRTLAHLSEMSLSSTSMRASSWSVRELAARALHSRRNTQHSTAQHAALSCKPPQRIPPSACGLVPHWRSRCRPQRTRASPSAPRPLCMPARTCTASTWDANAQAKDRRIREATGSGSALGLHERACVCELCGACGRTAYLSAVSFCALSASSSVLQRATASSSRCPSSLCSVRLVCPVRRSTSAARRWNVASSAARNLDCEGKHTAWHHNKGSQAMDQHIVVGCHCSGQRLCLQQTLGRPLL